MTLDRMCFSTLGAHPFTLERGAKRRVPRSHLCGQQTANSCLTQFHQRVIKRPMRGDRGYVCTFHSDRSTPPLAAFEQNCPNSLSCSIFGTVAVSVAMNSIIHFISTRHWRTYELGVTVWDVSESRVTLRDSESKLWLTRKSHYCCNWHCTATWWKITDGGGQPPSECH